MTRSERHPTTVWTLIRARGWLPALISTMTCSALGLWFGSFTMSAVVADGQRRLCQALIFIHPAIASTALIDRLPSISATVSRERTLAWLSVAGYWLSIAIVTLTSLNGLGVGSPDWRYLGSVALSLAAIAAVGTVRWGSVGLLAHIVISLSWLSGATTVALVLGFGTYPNSGYLSDWAWWAPLPHVALAVVAIVLLDPRRRVINRSSA